MEFPIPVDRWTIRPRPERVAHDGYFVRLEPLEPAIHAAPMFDAHQSLDPQGRNWEYLPYGPYEALADYRTHLERQAASDDPLFFAIIEQTSGEAVGVASLMRMDPTQGVIETGHICYTRRLQRTPGGTEAMYLLARHIFEDLGYRRYEWKCNNANEASKRAAERLGFVAEGVFRQHMVVKGQNRDTAWFSMLDREWPERWRRFEAWLDPANFDAQGRQRMSLNQM